MSKFIIDTKKSMYPPVVVEIDGIEYTAKIITQKIFKKVKEWDDAVKVGDEDAIYERVCYLLGEKVRPILEKRDFREVNDLSNYLMEHCFSSKLKEKTEEGKNVKSPGEKE